MSYERERSTSGIGHRPAGPHLPFEPGKANLVGAAIQHRASPGGGPAGPGKGTLTGMRPVTRDAEPAEDWDDVEEEPVRPFEPRITTPAPGGGANVAATVVGATAEPELARDGGFTPALIAALHANPDASIDEVLQHVAAFPICGEPGDYHVQHPTIVQYGRMPQGAQGAQGGEPPKKHAVLIANESYDYERTLYTPIPEACQMQAELSSRGYAVDIHADKTAADMDSLWGSLVGLAKPGDDLVAHYGGHGRLEGLLGIEHAPSKPDLLTNAQISGLVSSATSKGAHIRFVMDSCHSGGQVQAVRDVRQNELAAQASSPDDQRRVEVLAVLREMKQRLLGIREERDTVSGEIRAALDQHTARPPDPANAEATRTWTKIGTTLRDIDGMSIERYGRAEDQLWAGMLPQIEAVRAIERYEAPPPSISGSSLGAQVNYLDDLWNAVSQPVEQSIANAGANTGANAGASSGGAAPAGATPPAAR